MQKTVITIVLFGILNISTSITNINAAFIPSFNEDSLPREELEKNRPTINFADQFEISLSTNELGLNLTERFYFDKTNQKLRVQLYYSILGLDQSKGFDMTLDEKNKTVVVQSDEDCKKTTFHDSLLPVNLFFQMFNQLTDYLGFESGHHTFKFKQFDESNEDSLRFYFVFDEQLNFVSASFNQTQFGEVSVDVVEPLKLRTFTQEDWYSPECKQIGKNILNSGNGWVSFMQKLVQHLFLKGQDIYTYLGIKPLDKLGEAGSETDDEPEDFEE